MKRTKLKDRVLPTYSRGGEGNIQYGYSYCWWRNGNNSTYCRYNYCNIAS